MDALNKRVDGIEEKLDLVIKLLQEREGWTQLHGGNVDA